MSGIVNNEKKIKRSIYAKPQSILMIYPPGLADAAFAEVQSILSDIWFSNKFTSKARLQKNAIRVDDIHMFAVMELLLRGKCFSDLRLIIAEDAIANMAASEKLLAAVNWDFYLSSEMSVRIKVDVGASPALHEGALKDLVAAQVAGTVGEVADAGVLLHLDVYKNRAVLSISLAGEPLYKRGYKTMLSKSAPLREDIAAACAGSAFRFAQKIDTGFQADALLAPFSGTGTFLFEYLLQRYNVAPCLLAREYAIQQMPLYRAETFAHLVKLAKEHCALAQSKPDQYFAFDTAEEANQSMLSSIDSFTKLMQANDIKWSGVNSKQCPRQEDFLKSDVAETLKHISGNVFMPMNPPYGIRLGKNNDTVSFYNRIAEQVNAVADVRGKNHVVGFVLCPNEQAWSAFCKTLKNAKNNTYHINQGGLDIRVLEFYI